MLLNRENDRVIIFYVDRMKEKKGLIDILLDIFFVIIF